MALGKNLKRKKLISDEEATPSKKKVEKKVVTKKKELIPESKTSKTKPAPKKKKAVKKKTAEPKVKKAVTQPKVKKETATPKVDEVAVKPELEKPVVVTEVEEVGPGQEIAQHQVIPQETKTQPQRAQPIIDPALPRFIAHELREKKDRLRQHYAEEIANMQDQTLQFVSFQVGGELYAMDIDQIKEIVQVPSLSQTPNTPDHIKGIANVRGNTYVVFDLATKFHVTENNDAKYLLIVSHPEINASLLLSFLPTTFKIEGKNISSEMRMIEDASLDVSYIKGIIQQEEKLIYYLDIVEMLKNDKAVVVPDQMFLKESE